MLLRGGRRHFPVSLLWLGSPLLVALGTGRPTLRPKFRCSPPVFCDAFWPGGAVGGCELWSRPISGCAACVFGGANGGVGAEPIPIDVYEFSAERGSKSFLAGSARLRVLVDKAPAARDHTSKTDERASFAQLAPMAPGGLGDEMAVLATAAAPVARISVEPGKNSPILKPCAIVQDGVQQWKTESC